MELYQLHNCMHWIFYSRVTNDIIVWILLFGYYCSANKLPPPLLLGQLATTVRYGSSSELSDEFFFPHRSEGTTQPKPNPTQEVCQGKFLLLNCTVRTAATAVTRSNIHLSSESTSCRSVVCWVDVGRRSLSLLFFFWNDSTFYFRITTTGWLFGWLLLVVSKVWFVGFGTWFDIIIVGYGT